MLSAFLRRQACFDVVARDDFPYFNLSPMGSRRELEYHDIHVTEKSLVVGDARYNLINVEVDAPKRQPDLLEVILD